MEASRIVFECVHLVLLIRYFLESTDSERIYVCV